MVLMVTVDELICERAKDDAIRGLAEIWKVAKSSSRKQNVSASEKESIIHKVDPEKIHHILLNRPLALGQKSMLLNGCIRVHIWHIEQLMLETRNLTSSKVPNFNVPASSFAKSAAVPGAPGAKRQKVDRLEVAVWPKTSYAVETQDLKGSGANYLEKGNFTDALPITLGGEDMHEMWKQCQKLAQKAAHTVTTTSSTSTRSSIANYVPPGTTAQDDWKLPADLADMPPPNEVDGPGLPPPVIDDDMILPPMEEPEPVANPIAKKIERVMKHDIMTIIADETFAKICKNHNFQTGDPGSIPEGGDYCRWPALPIKDKLRGPLALGRGFTPKEFDDVWNDLDDETDALLGVAKSAHRPAGRPEGRQQPTNQEEEEPMPLPPIEDPDDIIAPPMDPADPQNFQEQYPEQPPAPPAKTRKRSKAERGIVDFSQTIKLLQSATENSEGKCTVKEVVKAEKFGPQGQAQLFLDMLSLNSIGAVELTQNHTLECGDITIARTDKFEGVANPPVAMEE